MHGNLDFTIEPCDLLLVCGDIVPLKIQYYTDDSFKWIKRTFIPWCMSLPCHKVVFVGGNHDWALYRHETRIKNMVGNLEKITYVANECCIYNDVSIYGTPLCHKFGDWAFMVDDEKIKRVYENSIKTDERIDIIISHDAPYGVSDVLLQEGFHDGVHIGCEPLLDLMEKTSPKLLLHGHLHSTNHEEEKHGGTSVYNVSLLDENYNMAYRPLYLDI